MRLPGLPESHMRLRAELPPWADTARQPVIDHGYVMSRRVVGRGSAVSCVQRRGHTRRGRGRAEHRNWLDRLDHELLSLRLWPDGLGSQARIWAPVVACGWPIGQAAGAGTSLVW